MAGCSEDFLCRDNFDAVSAVSRFYNDDVNLYQAVRKIATDEKDQHKCYLCVSSLHSHIISITLERKDLVYQDTSSVAKKICRGHFKICAKKKKVQLPAHDECNYRSMMSAIHIGSETNIYRIPNGNKFWRQVATISFIF